MKIENRPNWFTPNHFSWNEELISNSAHSAQLCLHHFIIFHPLVFILIPIPIYSPFIVQYIGPCVFPSQIKLDWSPFKQKILFSILPRQFVDRRTVAVRDDVGSWLPEIQGRELVWIILIIRVGSDSRETNFTELQFCRHSHGYVKNSPFIYFFKPPLIVI